MVCVQGNVTSLILINKMSP